MRVSCKFPRQTCVFISNLFHQLHVFRWPNKGENKVLAVLHYTKAPHHEDVCGNGDTAPRILNLATKGRWVVSLTFTPPVPTRLQSGYVSEPVWTLTKP